MHACELVELAGILSAQAPLLVRGTRLSASGMQEYWTASKCRLDRWARSLRSFTHDASQLGPTGLRVQWPYVRGVLEEILTGELLTRVWTAVLCLCDRQQGTQDSEPIARSVMIGHLEARHRVLMLLIQGPGITAEAAVKLNHLRRRTERWSDLLVGHLSGLGEVAEFSVDADRARDFAQDLQRRCNRGSQQAWPLLLTSLRMGFRRGLEPVSPNADLNARIASAILSCLPAELFDSTGLFQSLWLTRLYHLTSDVEGMIENLLGPEEPASPPMPGGIQSPLPGRMRRFGK